MIQTSTLADELAGVAKTAGDLARKVRGCGDLPAPLLAGAYVEGAKLRGRLVKLAAKVDAARDGDGDGESGKG